MSDRYYFPACCAAKADAVVARYDALLASLRVELARVTRERDALKAGKWAGPWERRSGWDTNDHAARMSVGGYPAVLAYRTGSFSGPIVDGESGSSIDEAKAAADAALIAAGWYLADGGE